MRAVEGSLDLSLREDQQTAEALARVKGMSRRVDGRRVRKLSAVEDHQPPSLKR